MSGLKNIVDVVQQMAHMSVATAWNKEGKPIKFTQITEKQRADAITNAVKLIDTKVNNLESNLHIEIDMERIEDKSKALSYIGIEIAEALKYIPAPVDEVLGAGEEVVEENIVANAILEPAPVKEEKPVEEIKPAAEVKAEETKGEEKKAEEPKRVSRLKVVKKAEDVRREEAEAAERRAAERKAAEEKQS